MMAVSIQTLTANLSFAASLNPRLFPKPAAAKPPPSLVIRMGGGPRTYPGGVSKWQWKRMQANKAKQLLKARLCRERQIYEMRKRAELRAAVSELERPWEAVSAAPALLSVSADDQLKALADRFQRPGGFDMWTADDGPQLFPAPDELPSSRFFPKGVVHSIKPYRREPIPDSEEKETSGGDDRRWKNPSNSEASAKRSYRSRYGNRLEPNGRASNSSKPNGQSGEAKPGSEGSSDSKSSNLSHRKSIRGRGHGGFRTKWSRNSENRGSGPRTEVHEMRLQEDGSYGFQ